MPGQWTLQESHTTAALRGIHHVGEGVAWASGTGGTILRTTDGGTVWQKCAMPPDAGKLDFRAIQGFDAQMAVAMSAGPGALSRIYRTTDGCKRWRLVITNPDAQGFWDALQFSGKSYGLLIGDPVAGQFPVFQTTDGGETWNRILGGGVRIAAEKQAIFAASNSSLLLDAPGGMFHFITGGTPAVFSVSSKTGAVEWMESGMAGGESGGGFSLASRQQGKTVVMVAVGGDYKSPTDSKGTVACWRYDRSLKTMKPVPVEAMPGGYRSAVTYDKASKTWVAVGPGGTDVSQDDGRRWRTVTPAAGEATDADKNWNALSWPFVVGPGGRIGRWHDR